jgi:ADP-ribosylglycohydrolase
MPLEGTLAPDWEGIERRTRGFEGDPVRGFGPDDDTSLMVRHLLEFEQFGESLTPDHLLRSWRRGYSREYLWKTERQALDRSDRGIPAAECGRGPLGDTLAARIRADLWGMLHPGDPAGALRLVEKDAVLSAAGTGMDSARFFAAASSLAFAEESVEGLLEAIVSLPAVALSPQVEMTRQLRTRHRAGESLKSLRAWIQASYFDQVHQRDPGHSWAWALPNDALVILALLEGRGDFARTVALAASLGWDTDCNAATAGCLLGILGGDRVLPQSFREALADRLRVAIPRREHWSLERLARVTAALARPRPGADPGSR